MHALVVSSTGPWPASIPSNSLKQVPTLLRLAKHALCPVRTLFLVSSKSLARSSSLIFEPGGLPLSGKILQDGSEPFCGKVRFSGQELLGSCARLAGREKLVFLMALRLDVDNGPVLSFRGL